MEALQGRRAEIAASERSARHNREVEAIKLEKTRRAAKEDENGGKLNTMKETIHKLWEALESEPSEIVTFLMKVENVSSFSEEALSEYVEEAGRLTDRVPITQAVTRREFLKYKL